MTSNDPPSDARSALMFASVKVATMAEARAGVSALSLTSTRVWTSRTRTRFGTEIVWQAPEKWHRAHNVMRQSHMVVMYHISATCGGHLSRQRKLLVLVCACVRVCHGACIVNATCIDREMSAYDRPLAATCLTEPLRRSCLFPSNSCSIIGTCRGSRCKRIFAEVAPPIQACA